VVAQVAFLHEQFEAALVSNDMGKLITFLWDSRHALRFGVGESLYGAKAIEFRRHRPSIDLTREVSNLQIVTFGDHCFRPCFSGAVPYGDLLSQLAEMPVRPETRESVRRSIDRTAAALARFGVR
jgi:hypothetical protein